MKTLLLIAAAWLIVAGAALIQFWPHIPQTKAQWALFIVFGPPAYVALEAAGEWAFGSHRNISDAARLGMVAIFLTVTAGLYVFFSK